MSPLLMLLAITAAVVVALSFLTAMIAEAQPPKQGFASAFLGSLIVWACIAVACEGLVIGAIRLVKYAMGGAP